MVGVVNCSLDQDCVVWTDLVFCPSLDFCTGMHWTTNVHVFPLSWTCVKMCSLQLLFVLAILLEMLAWRKFAMVQHCARRDY